MPKYNPDKIEKKWQKKWIEEKVYEPNLGAAKKPFYNLWMFPYPSAEGLHIGGARTFIGADIFGRFKRMQGYDVLEPVGLDGFGIHSENYALKIGKHPIEHAKDSEKNFYRQLHMLGNGYAWDEKLETYDPTYYRWTQWIFIQMWKRGLAYRKKQAVNWCPKDKTVLADEQVEGGTCERCGAIVEKKELEQWFLKITDYAERLLDNIPKLDWSEKVKIAQRNWIGRSEGAEIEFHVKDQGSTIKIFTTRPDTLFGATYVVLAPEHELITGSRSTIVNFDEVKEYIEKAKNKKEEERTEEKEKTGVELKGVKAVNPANGEEIPIWVADYVLGSYGTGAIMAVPAHDERDAKFAKKFNLGQRFVIDPKEKFESLHFGSPDVDGYAITKESYETWYELLKKEIVQPVKYTYYTGSGYLINSGKFSGMDSEKAKWEITKFVHGERKIKFRLRDWLISRQRYWGPPIPMIHCGACAKNGKGERQEMPGWYAVPEDQLPVLLPYMKDFRPTGSDQSPLASDKEFYEAPCPACGTMARRETDVSDTFLDSSWYYLRYPSVHDEEHAWNPVITKKWLPVDSYIGGAEHSVLHLLYARFVTMAFCDMGFLDFDEPFTKFVAHGLITKDGAKMSKSKGNVVNPDEYFKKFGADVMRMHLAFMSPLQDDGDFRDSGILGIERFLVRVWKLAEGQGGKKKEEGKKNEGSAALIHKTVKKVTEDTENLHYNTAISALMVTLRTFEEKGPAPEELEIFLKLLAPFAPHIAEEIWRETLGKKGSIHRAAWPSYDEALIKEDKFTLVIQINGKVKDAINDVDAAMFEEAVKDLALQREKIIAALNGREPERIIYVAKKIVNIVI